ncbi:MAG: Asp23/Gls24 family envelope stress response protein [Chlamydiae bacterium]|nr:Asp23/Gls24 family envelope stress response protein [Chlamydiota bacterium]
MLDQFNDMDTKELDLPDTVFIRDIESRVFQAIAIKCLSDIKGIALIEGTLFDNLLGREGLDRVKGIHVEQDSKNHSVNMKIELNIAYGISLPEKAEEIQTKLVKDIIQYTGLHVACVHVVFKNLIPEERFFKEEAEELADTIDEEFANEF